MPCGYYNSTGLPYNHQPHFPKGNVPVNKGKKGLLKQTESAKDKIRQYQKGRKKSLAARINMSNGQRGEKGSNWQGGKEPKNKVIRKSIEYRLWREAVFARDGWICQKCKSGGGYLHPHHIRNFSEEIDSRFNPNNGITLHKECHKLFHNLYGQKNNNLDQINQFVNKFK